jgi:hypothetical protein
MYPFTSRLFQSLTHPSAIKIAAFALAGAIVAPAVLMPAIGFTTAGVAAGTSSPACDSCLMMEFLQVPWLPEFRQELETSLRDPSSPLCSQLELHHS